MADAMARFWVTARISSPSRVKRSMAEQSEEHREGEADDPQPVIGDGEMADLEGAAHPGRRRHLAVGRAEDGAHRLLDDERQAPGGEQGFERPAVEEADDAALDEDADQAGDDEGQRHGDDQRLVEQARIARSRITSWTDEGHVGAEHHHLAMGHVDDAHDAEGDGEPDGGEQQHRAERDAVPGVLRRLQMASSLEIERDRAGGSRVTDAGVSAGSADSSADRVLIAALADDGDGGDLVGVAGVRS